MGACCGAAGKTTARTTAYTPPLDAAERYKVSEEGRSGTSPGPASEAASIGSGIGSRAVSSSPLELNPGTVTAAADPNAEVTDDASSTPSGTAAAASATAVDTLAPGAPSATTSAGSPTGSPAAKPVAVATATSPTVDGVAADSSRLGSQALFEVGDAESVSSDDDHVSTDEDDEYQQRGGSRKVVYVVGPPGSGKSRVMNKLKVEFSALRCMDISDLLAEYVNSSVESGVQEVAECIMQGKPVDVEVAIKTVQRFLTSGDSEEDLSKASLVIGGFPQTLEQARAFDKRVCKATLLIVMDAEREVCLQRIVKRSTRFADEMDNEDCQSSAFDGFQSSIGSIVEYMLETGSSIERVNASEPAEDVWQHVSAIVTRFVTRQTSALQRSYRSIHLPDQAMGGLDLRENSIRVMGGGGVGGGRRLSIQEMSDLSVEVRALRASESMLVKRTAEEGGVDDVAVEVDEEPDVVE